MASSKCAPAERAERHRVNARLCAARDHHVCVPAAHLLNPHAVNPVLPPALQPLHDRYQAAARILARSLDNMSAWEMLREPESKQTEGRLVMQGKCPARGNLQRVRLNAANCMHNPTFNISAWPFFASSAKSSLSDRQLRMPYWRDL